MANGGATMRNQAIRRAIRATAMPLVFGVAACACVATCSAADGPRETLIANGLVNLGDAWLCPAEAEARRLFDALDPLERHYQGVQRAVDDRIKVNEKAKADLAQKRRDLKVLAEKITANDPAALGPTREQLIQSAKDLDDQIKRLKQVAKDGTRLAEFQPAREDVIRLSNARVGLTLAAAALRQRTAEMPAEYERLEKIAAVRAALRQLPQQRLGTGKDYTAEAAERLARIDRATQSNVVPVYRDDGHARVVTIVNESTPVTFSLRHSDGPTHLPHSVVTSLNLSTEDAPVVSYTVGGRKLRCRRVTLSSVRVGGLLLRNVEALALPPEGEDLGAKLGRAAYASFYFDVDFSQLRMTILDGSAKDDAAKREGKQNGDSKNVPSTGPMSRPGPRPGRRSASRSTIPLPLPSRSAPPARRD